TNPLYEDYTPFFCYRYFKCVTDSERPCCLRPTAGHCLARCEGASSSGEFRTSLQCRLRGCRQGGRIAPTPDLWRSGMEEVHPGSEWLRLHFYFLRQGRMD